MTKSCDCKKRYRKHGKCRPDKLVGEFLVKGIILPGVPQFQTEGYAVYTYFKSGQVIGDGSVQKGQDTPKLGNPEGTFGTNDVGRWEKVCHNKYKVCTTRVVVNIPNSTIPFNLFPIYIVKQEVELEFTSDDSYAGAGVASLCNPETGIPFPNSTFPISFTAKRILCNFD